MLLTSRLISVVCASVGRDSLLPLVRGLTCSTHVGEILIILPPNVTPSSDLIEFCENIPSISILWSSYRGQVHQRVFGVRQARYEYVLFIDDDIDISRSCVDQLSSALSFLPDLSVIAPRIRVRPIARASRSWSFSIYALSVMYIFDRVLSFNLFQVPYSLSYFHIPLCVTSSNFLPSKVQWLPGGCILMPTCLAPKESYYMFPGKAYGEDVFLSTYLIDNNASLYLDSKSVVYTNDESAFQGFNIHLFVRLAIHRLSRINSLPLLLAALILLPLHLLISYSLLFLSSKIKLLLCSARVLLASSRITFFSRCGKIPLSVEN